MLVSTAEFGWPPWEPVPRLTDEQYNAVCELEEAVHADKAPAVLLDPRELVPTWPHVDTATLTGLIDVEFVPAILVIQFGGRKYIYDGHHRATRARIDNQLVRSVVFDADRG